MIKGFRLFGITVYLHWSLLLLIAMIALPLMSKPNVPMWAGAIVGVVFALVLLGSVVVHEFAHSLVGRRFGIGFSQITLFIFGGAAKMDNQVTSAKAEMIMAAAGPAASFVLFLLCSGLSLVCAAIGNDKLLVVASVALDQVGYLNLLLAVFNMIPAFPMDGGRVLRAAIWAKTKNFRKATKIAAYTGKVFGWTLIACGVLMIFGFTVPWFGTGMGNGVWIGFMGWLIGGMANAELQRANQ